MTDELRTKTGRVLSEEEIQALADEAERGYDLCPVPGCGIWKPKDDLAAQREHMESKHPEVVEERLRESMRFDGWEQD